MGLNPDDVFSESKPVEDAQEPYSRDNNYLGLTIY